MKTSFTRLAVAVALASAFALSQAASADSPVQPRAGSFAPKPNTANPDNGVIPTHPKPAIPAIPAAGSFKAAPTACLPGWSQVELKHDTYGHLSRMTCQSPIIECPDPGPGYTVGIDVAKQILDADDGRFRIQYRCTYYRIQG